MGKAKKAKTKDKGKDETEESEQKAEKRSSLDKETVQKRPKRVRIEKAVYTPPSPPLRRSPRKQASPKKVPAKGKNSGKSAKNRGPNRIRVDDPSSSEEEAVSNKGEEEDEPYRDHVSETESESPITESGDQQEDEENNDKTTKKTKQKKKTGEEKEEEEKEKDTKEEKIHTGKKIQKDYKINDDAIEDRVAQWLEQYPIVWQRDHADHNNNDKKEQVWSLGEDEFHISGEYIRVNISYKT